MLAEMGHKLPFFNVIFGDCYHSSCSMNIPAVNSYARTLSFLIALIIYGTNITYVIVNCFQIINLLFPSG